MKLLRDKDRITGRINEFHRQQQLQQLLLVLVCEESERAREGEGESVFVCVANSIHFWAMKEDAKKRKIEERKKQDKNEEDAVTVHLWSKE